MICIFKKGSDNDLKVVETCRPTERNNIIKKGCIWLIFTWTNFRRRSWPSSC